MNATPNYGYHKDPRFSATHMAEYLATTSARQREVVIREAKFPRKATVVPYQIARRIIRTFMAKGTGKLSDLDEHVRQLETRMRREADGWMQDELRRNIDAIGAFKKLFGRRRGARYDFSPGPFGLGITVETVRISVRLDVGVTETSAEGVTYSGGCIIFTANTDASRKNIADRRKSVTSIIRWSLEDSNRNIEPLPRLCMLFDLFGDEITKAPDAVDRFRGHVHSACREAASQWKRVEPPSGYDGPEWREPN